MNTTRDHEFDNMFKRNFTMLIKQQIEEQRKVLEVRAVEKIAKYIREITKHPGFKYNTEEIIQLTQNLSRFTVSRTRDFDDIDNLMDNTESWLRKIVENVLHGENHYKKYDMDQRKQLVNNIINTYVRLRKISHVINDIVIEFDPHRANRFLEWIIYLGSKREIQNESSGSEVISYRPYLYQNFSEAE
ncbi:MAG: hypothetical protein NZ908_02375, partial [Candidatus Micrarchaeota archaeon]|nr:hypothetical protein [Candidatus Micrarchaeota archaeon]